MNGMPSSCSKSTLRMLVRCFCALSLAMLSASQLYAQAQNVFFQPPTFKGFRQSPLFGPKASGDVNGDGKLDLVFNDGAVLLGNQDGTLHTGTTWSVAGSSLDPRSIYINLADFDGDGRLDLVIVEQNALLVLRGNGDGTFQTTPISTTTGAALAQFFVADANGDGRMDVLMNEGGAPLVFLGNGDGTFKLAFAGPANGNVTWRGVEDFNRDGKVDILFTGFDGLGVLLGNGDGTFQASPVVSGGFGIDQTVVGDFNGDGYVDVVLTDHPVAGCSRCAAAESFLGNGDGTFTLVGTLFSFSDYLNRMTLGASDVNKDGKLDLVVTNSGDVQILLGNGDGTFSSANAYFLDDFDWGPGSTFIGDFNGDGNPDIATGGTLFLGKGNGNFQGNSAVVTSYPVVVSDLDGDGNIDLVTSCANCGVSTLFGDGTDNFPDVRTFSLAQPGRPPDTGTNVGVADLNGDGIPDLLLANSDDSSNLSLWVLLGNGNRTFGAPLLGAQGQNRVSLLNPYADPIPMVIADFNNDRKPDVAVLDYTGYLQVFLGKGDGTFTETPVYFVGSQASSIVAADFNADGIVDFVVGTGAGLGLLLGKGDGTFETENFFNSGLTSVSLTADLNGDGVPDLIAYNNNANQVLLGNGDGTFLPLPSQLPFTPFAVGDFNGDGKLDIAGTPNVFYALGNGDGTFGNAVFLRPPVPDIQIQSAVPSRPLVADFNNDHRPDIVFGISKAFTEVVTLLNVAQPSEPDFLVAGSRLLPSVVKPGNSAKSTVTLTAIGSFAGNVALSCGFLPSGANCSFSPATLSGGTSTLTITTVASTPIGSFPITIVGTGPSSVHNASLTLTVATSSGATTAGVAPNSLSFPVQAIGTTSSPGVVQLTNTGTAPLNLSSISITGTNASEFAQTNSCSATVPLAPGNSCQISVTFTPRSLGTRSASVSITDNATGSPQFVVLTGQVADFSMSSSPASTTVSPGQTATYAISFASSTGFNQAVALSCSGAPALTTCAISPSSVQLNGAATVSANISITTTAPKAALVVPFWHGPLTLQPHNPARLLLVLFGITLFLAMLVKFRGEQTRGRVFAASMFLLAIGVAMSSCGGGSSSTGGGGGGPGTQAGTYTITISATPTGATSPAHTITLMLVVQ